jgi:probable O-glycosylation ligase (exosortase A-associated)
VRDLVFVAFLAAIFGMGLRRPFLLVLAYVYIDIVSPQRLTYILLNTVPISLIAVAMAVGGWLVMDDKSDSRFTPRQGLIVLLLLYCWGTTAGADFPLDAKDKWDWVWKCLAFAAFLPLTLRTRLRIEALLLFMILSAASIIIVGGIKTAAGGGGYGQLDLMVNNNSGLYEGSTISTVAIAIVPLIAWFMRYGTIFPPDWKVKGFCLCLIFACLLIPIGTSTRTGTLCTILVALLSLRNAKRKLLYVSLIAAAGLIAVPFLPASFTERMSTIKSHDADESASTRLAVWQWTIDYAKQHPFGGGFDAYRGNHIRYEIRKVASADGAAAPTITDQAVTDKARGYHSAYFEMLGEQGYMGLALWLGIHLIGLFRMEILRRRYGDPDGEFGWAGPLAASLQTAHLVYLLGAAFIAIAFQPFVYMLIGAQIGLDSYLARRRAETAKVPMRAPRPAPVTAA